MIAIGIDPGLSGAVAVLKAPDGFHRSTEEAVVHDMPTVIYGKTTKKRALDLNALARILLPYADLPCQVFLERVGAMPGQGVSSMFSLGMSYWGAAGVVAGIGLPLNLIQPQAWKSHFRLDAEKDLARGLASRMYPGVDLSKKKDHGKAEALLIARYGQINYKGRAT